LNQRAIRRRDLGLQVASIEDIRGLRRLLSARNFLAKLMLKSAMSRRVVDVRQFSLLKELNS
jgi:hypothetical protein